MQPCQKKRVNLLKKTVYKYAFTLCSYFNNSILIFGTLWEERALFSLLKIKSGPCPPSLQEAVEIVLTSAVCSQIQDDSSGKSLLFVLSSLMFASGSCLCLFVILRSDVGIQRCWGWHLSEDFCENESGHTRSQREIMCQCKQFWHQIVTVLESNTGNSLNICILCSFIILSYVDFYFIFFSLTSL